MPERERDRVDSWRRGEEEERTGGRKIAHINKCAQAHSRLLWDGAGQFGVGWTCCGATSRKRQQKYRKSVKNVGLDFRSVPAEGASGEGASASDVIWGEGTQVAIVIIIAAMNVMSIYGCFIEYVQISHILLVHV